MGLDRKRGKGGAHFEREKMMQPEVIYLKANDDTQARREKLSTKYFALHMLHNDNHVPVVVWNGVRDFANDPFPFLKGWIANVGKAKVYLVEVSKPVLTKERKTIKDVLSALAGIDTAIALLTKDQMTYDTVVLDIRKGAAAHPDGWQMQ
jgi:hypothetical protein